MPFQADTRCGFIRVSLNVSVVCEELEQLLEKTYEEDINVGSDFWLYVSQIENLYEEGNLNIHFWEWFVDNFDNVLSWNTIQDNFKEDEE